MYSRTATNDGVRRVGALLLGTAAAATLAVSTRHRRTRRMAAWHSDRSTCTPLGQLLVDRPAGPCGGVRPGCHRHHRGDLRRGVRHRGGHQRVRRDKADDVFNTALAIGDGTVADAEPASGTLQWPATADSPYAYFGNFNIATARGTGSKSNAYNGSFNIAMAMGRTITPTPALKLVLAISTWPPRWRRQHGERHQRRLQPGDRVRPKQLRVCGAPAIANRVMVFGKGNNTLVRYGDGNQTIVIGEGNLTNVGGGVRNRAIVVGENNIVNVGDPANPSAHRTTTRRRFKVRATR